MIDIVVDDFVVDHVAVVVGCVMVRVMLSSSSLSCVVELLLLLALMLSCCCCHR